MTKELRVMIGILATQLGPVARVLEIGSRTASNQEELGNLRELFPGCEYIGVDMQEGPGVDVVADAVELPFSDKSFDLVLCLETLEHADKPWLIAKEIERVSKKSGCIIISSQQNFPLHMHPSDYFRYTPYGLASLIGKSEHKLAATLSPPFADEVRLNPSHVVVIAWNGKPKLKNKLKRVLRAGIGKISQHKPYRHRLQDGVKFLVRGIQEAWYRSEIAIFDDVEDA